MKNTQTLQNPRQIVVLGSTGSIGTQTLDVIRTHPDLKLKALSAHTNASLLNEQAREFSVPENLTCLSSLNPEKLEVLASLENSTVVNAIVGNVGLYPTIAALKAGNSVALANKETLVTAGELVMALSKKHNAPIIPVDSEHSAIMQCIEASNKVDDNGVFTFCNNQSLKNKIKRIILTASGGAFRGYTKEQLKTVTKSQALTHPNWSMGNKITIDSSTLMNKGLELIEAVNLFGVDPSCIEIVIHPQSIVHSAVEFEDGCIIAQLSEPDMRLPIQYALTYPRRLKSPIKSLSLTDIKTLTFEKPDTDTFTALELSRQAAIQGGNAPCILNTANEVAVSLFLEDKIAFYEIIQLVEKTFTKAEKTKEISLEIINETEKQIRALFS